MRFGGLSPLLIGAFVLALAALVLFLLPGILSNRGGGGEGHHSPPPSIAAATETAGPPTPSPSPTPKTYTVKAGDSLTKIATQNGVDMQALACFNNIKNLNALQIGQVLQIPPQDYVCPGSATQAPKHQSAPPSY